MTLMYSSLISSISNLTSTFLPQASCLSKQSVPSKDYLRMWISFCELLVTRQTREHEGSATCSCGSGERYLDGLILTDCSSQGIGGLRWCALADLFDLYCLRFCRFGYSISDSLFGVSDELPEVRVFYGGQPTVHPFDFFHLQISAESHERLRGKSRKIARKNPVNSDFW